VTAIENFMHRIDRILAPEPIDSLIAQCTELVNRLVDIRPESYGEARIVDDEAA
jgi:hypothetical protein